MDLTALFECLAWDVISASKTQNTPAQWQTKPAIAQGYPIHHARACLAGQKQRQQRGAPVSTASRLSSLTPHPPTLRVATIPKFSPRRGKTGHPD